ncbi:MAG: SufS family cysteine desulfurase [Parasporobacterium sp.]|nr:SufS family cysteine desulfurase [Parasporobacterium sp.]
MKNKHQKSVSKNSSQNERKSGMKMKTWEEIRDDFPILKETINNQPLIYLDNAATTQIPKQVMDCWVEHYTKYNGNVHRGIHTLAELSTSHMEAVREKVLNFLNAKELGQIVFTSGATDSANLVAQSFLKHRLKPGDIVLSTELEHHANYVVWQQLCLECGAQFQVIPTIDGDLDLEAAEKMISENVKFFATTAVSNVLGTVVDIRKLIGLAKKYEIPVFIDAAQALRHESFDLASLDCDFLGFSAHKMMGPTGVGCLFIRDKWLDEMKPWRYGGGMVDIVKEESTSFADVPARLEAGTPNYSGIIAFGAAIDYLSAIGFSRIFEREEELTAQAEKLLREIPEVTVLGNPGRRAGVLSIFVDGVHPYDLASFIDKFGVAVRTGSMCAQPIVRKYGAETVTRISPAFYNTPEELKQAVETLKIVIALIKQAK